MAVEGIRVGDRVVALLPDRDRAGSGLVQVAATIVSLPRWKETAFEIDVEPGPGVPEWVRNWADTDSLLVDESNIVGTLPRTMAREDVEAWLTGQEEA